MSEIRDEWLSWRTPTWSPRHRLVGGERTELRYACCARELRSGTSGSSLLGLPRPGPRRTYTVVPSGGSSCDFPLLGHAPAPTRGRLGDTLCPVVEAGP